MMRLIATVGGVGYLRPAPGTWGSLAALPLAWALHQIGGFWLLFAVTGALTIVGYWATEAMTADQDNKDPSEIVVDEVVGQWIALWPVSLGATLTDSNVLALWPGILSAFVLFRLFDILKPGPVGWADSQPGAFGVMADDVIAGWMAALLAALLAAVAHLAIL